MLPSEKEATGGVLHAGHARFVLTINIKR